MRIILFLFPLGLLLLSGCSSPGEEYKTFSPPSIHHFELKPDGSVYFYGKGFDEMKQLDVDFDFSISAHEALGESAIACFGEKPEIVNDTTLLLKPSSYSKMQVVLRTEKIPGKTVDSIIKPARKDKEKTILLPESSYAPMIAALIPTNRAYTIWLSLRDPSKQFWDPQDKTETTVIFGHYELWFLNKGNMSGYNRKKLHWMERRTK